MNKIALVFVALFLIISCSKKEVKFEAFSSEAFAYDIGDGIAEVNASVRIKGFTQTERNGSYDASINFSIDLVRPDNSVVKSVFKDVKRETKTEPINDVALEAQFNLDSTYADGNYKLIFNITDNHSESTTVSEVKFDLSR